MSHDEFVCEISVCVDCMHLHANGEYSPDREATEPEPLSLIEFGFSVALGGEHSDHCTPADRDEGCDCENLGFSHASCDGCGSGLAGDRFRMSLFRLTRHGAVMTAHSAIRSARGYRRTAVNRVMRVRMLNYAEKLRRYALTV